MAATSPWSTWNNLAPSPDTWTQFAYTTTWQTWRQLLSLTVSCPSIEVFNCSTAQVSNDSLPNIVVYSTSNNLNILKLYDKGSLVSLNSTTKIEIRLDSGLTISSASYPSLINWNTGADPLGVVTLKLGEMAWETKIYTAELMVFDAINTFGNFWGLFRIQGIEDTING